jgi:hypothetical protein
MKLGRYIKLSFIAFCLLIGTAGLSSAALLVTYQGTEGLGVTSQNQPLAKVVVGASNVEIGSFGVYGQAQVAGNLKWLIFDSTQLSSPVFISAAQAVSARPGAFAANAQWYDSPTMNFTLLAGHTYAMGVISDQYTFRWGSSADSPFGPGPSITGGGLTLEFMQSLVNGVFVGTPTLYTVNNSNRRETSLRVSSPEPVPIPGAVWLLGSGLLGLVGLRRRFKK